MQRIGNIKNQFERRKLRIIIGHTEATPYPGIAHPSLFNTDGSFRKPLAADTTPVARSADAFTYLNGLPAGIVMLQAEGDSFVVATGADVAALTPAGLLGNSIGGELDELGDNREIAVWKGQGTQAEIYAPAFNDTGLAAAYAAATPGNPVKLYAGTDGRLITLGAPSNRVPVATLRERSGPGKIIVDLLA